jgi:hypothetical protein
VDELVGPGMDGYQILLLELKLRIRTARLQAALAVNQELILLYWGIGRESRAVRTCPTTHQGPLQLRLSNPGPGPAGARS